MFRISQYMRELAHAEKTGQYPEAALAAARPARSSSGT